MRLIQLFFTTVVLTSILSSCGHVSVLDKEQCADEGSLGAHCAHEYSNQTRDIGQPDWDNTRFGWFCMDPSDTVESKKEAEELCSIRGVTCDYKGQRAIQAAIHHHFLFTDKMLNHVKRAKERLQRRAHGLESIYSRPIEGGPGMAKDPSPDNFSMVSRPIDAPAKMDAEKN